MDKKICITGEISGSVTFNIYTKPETKDEVVVVTPESKRRKVIFGPIGQADWSQVFQRPQANSGAAAFFSVTDNKDDDEEMEELRALYEYHKNNPDYFQMTIRPKGIVLVINNRNFHHSAGLGDRLGSKNDCKNLFEAFSDIGGCDISVKSDLLSDQMVSELKSLARSEKQAAFYAIFIMSHGTSHYGKDMVFGADGVRVSSKEIVDLFNVPHLKETPKLMFFQACRGRKEGAAAFEPPQQFGERHDGESSPVVYSNGKDIDTDLDQEILNCLIDVLPNSRIIGVGPADVKDAVPYRNNPSSGDCSPGPSGRDAADEAGEEYVDSHPNVMVSLATAEGYTSLRNEESGSWLIQEVCKQLSSPAAKEEDLISLMTRIHNQLHDRRSQNYTKYKAAARTAYTFNKKLCFFPGL